MTDQNTEKMGDSGSKCLEEIVSVLSNYDNVLVKHDALDILCHLAMIFENQQEKRASWLLHEAGMDMAFYHGLACGLTGKE